MFKKIFETPQHLEGPFGPSMVEPCHNLSLEELVRDYTLGIVHSERPAMYDDGDDVPDDPVETPTDLSEVGDFAPSARSASRSARASEAQPSEQSKNGTGTEAVEVGGGPEEGAAPPPDQE